MTNLEITLSIILLLSIAGNIALFVYARAAIEHARSFTEQQETFEYIYGLIEDDSKNTDTTEEKTPQEA